MIIQVSRERSGRREDHGDILEPSVKSYTFLGSNETKIEQPVYVFSTVNDVRQFHQVRDPKIGTEGQF